MESNEGTKPKKAAGEEGHRTRWPEYTDLERQLLDHKFRPPGDWESLEFMNDFWNVVHDEKDLQQYRRLARVWQMRCAAPPIPYSEIGTALEFDKIEANRMFSGKNQRTNLAEMYLNRAMLGRPRNGWKWILECTPKPTNPYPKATQVPEQIRDYGDVLEFLKQFPRIPESNPNLSFFGVTSGWAEAQRPQLFSFLLAFLVGDGGKYYSEYESRARHYRKAAMTTNMKRTDSNFRVLRYVQLCLETIGIPSGEIDAHTLPNGYEVIRWNSVYSNLITWIVRVCMGLKEGERTSENPIKMEWLLGCPHDFIVAFLQGLGRLGWARAQVRVLCRHQQCSELRVLRATSQASVSRSERLSQNHAPERTHVIARRACNSIVQPHHQ